MIITVILVIIDRIVKLFVMENKVNIVVIPKLLNFTYVENRGMVFGLAQGSSYIMGVISVFICIAIIIYIIKSKNNDEFCYAWYLILAGGVGNAIDRFAYGFVVDFIDTPWIATFNLADIFIVLGVITLLLSVLFRSNTKHKNETGDKF